jgi:hypothetical protein
MRFIETSTLERFEETRPIASYRIKPTPFVTSPTRGVNKFLGASIALAFFIGFAACLCELLPSRHRIHAGQQVGPSLRCKFGGNRHVRTVALQKKPRKENAYEKEFAVGAVGAWRLCSCSGCICVYNPA